jgi:ABC-type xylose transport system permease subunit
MIGALQGWSAWRWARGFGSAVGWSVLVGIVLTLVFGLVAGWQSGYWFRLNER